ncbi:hypothetical protein MMC18_008101 [Xylographa bjoerkii]|nr:hypothetical protein [Xylographa bjoerkii]
MTSPDVKQVTVYYCAPHALYQKVKPYLIDYEIEGGFPRTNIIPEAHQIMLQDIRGREDSFDFESSGFGVAEMQTSMSYDDFRHPDTVRDVYCQEVASCLLQYTDAAAVQVFDFAVTDKLPALQPAMQVHVDSDSSHENLKWIVQSLQGGNAECMSAEQRCTYCNVWRPLKGPVLDWSLAMCNAQTVLSEDLMSTDVLGGKHMLTEDMRVFYNERHEWFYLSNQTPDELLIFRQADTNSTFMGVPHTSFSDPSASQSDYLRESVEIRAIIYHKSKLKET